MSTISQANCNTLLAVGGAVAAAATGAYFFLKRLKKPKGKPVLTYFNGRGLAEFSRLLLAEAGVAYEDKRIERKDFEVLKATGCFPFGQVPIYQQGTFILPQSLAIARYIAHEHDLYGSSSEEAAVADSVVDAVFGDLGTAWRTVNYEKNEEKKAEAKVKFENEILPRWTSLFDSFIKSNQWKSGWVVGNKISFADIALFHIFDTLLKTYPTCLNNTPELKALVERVAQRPAIAKWVRERPQTDF